MSKMVSSTQHFTPAISWWSQNGSSETGGVWAGVTAGDGAGSSAVGTVRKSPVGNQRCVSQGV